MAKNFYVDSSGVRANLQRMYKTLPVEAERAMDKALNAGVRVAKADVRRDTLKLMKSIKKNPIKKGKGRISGTFSAYAENTSGKDYAGYQEEGFTHWKSGEWIEGTHYIRNGRRRAETVLLEESKKQIRRLAKGK
jgi:hypothetical protein